MGGGSHALRPGEISVATNGVLFLDELPEFPTHVLETLRQPLESGRMSINRAALSTVLPADFLLVAAMNPCPCGGGRGDPSDCTCGDDRVRRYRSRLSGPVLDRFDLRIRGGASRRRPAHGHHLGRVDRRRRRSRRRRPDPSARPAGRAQRPDRPSAPPTTWPRSPTPREPRCATNSNAGGLSGRGYHRVRRLGRTIADRRGGDAVELGDVDLALQLRTALSARTSPTTGVAA